MYVYDTELPDWQLWESKARKYYFSHCEFSKMKRGRHKWEVLASETFHCIDQTYKDRLLKPCDKNKCENFSRVVPKCSKFEDAVIFGQIVSFYY